MKILKNVFLSVGIFVFTLVLVGLVSANKAYAANTCTALATGDWHTSTNWTNCGAVVPQSGDTVIIPTGVILTMSGNAPLTGSLAAVTINDPVNASNGVTFGTYAMTVTGAFTLTGSSGTGDSTVTVGAGTLTAGSIVINDGAAAGGDSIVNATTGNISTTLTTGGISFTGTTAADRQLTVTSTGTVTLGGTTGTIGTGGTVALDATSTTAFTGTGAQTINVYTYGNLTINKTVGQVATLDTGTIPIAGILTVTSGTLDMAASVPTVTGVTNIASNGTLLLTSATGLKTFTGLVTNAGTWTESAVAVAVTFAGGLTNTGTFTATPNTTGVHTFSGAAKTITGTVAIPSVSVSGTVSNTGTLTVATLLTVAGTLTNTGTVTATTSLEGGGGFVNGAAGVLNIGDANTITTFDATNDTNTVNYTKAGAQTVKDGTTHEYGHLGLSGSGAKTITAATLIAGNITFGGTATATLSGIANTANKLYFGTSLQRNGTWGSTTETHASHTNNTYFTAGVDALVTVATGSSGNSGSVITNQTVYTNTATPATPATPAVPTVTPAVPAVPATPVAGCSAGNLFNTSTGAVCVNNASAEIPGCGNRATGFSTATGGSCVGNTPATTTTVTTTTTTTTTTSTYSFGTSTLKNGSRGEGVKELQRFLNTKLNLGLVVDGSLGPKTIAVIKQWQSANGLVADGLVGAKTKAKMNAQ